MKTTAFIVCLLCAVTKLTDGSVLHHRDDYGHVTDRSLTYHADKVLRNFAFYQFINGIGNPFVKNVASGDKDDEYDRSEVESGKSTDGSDMDPMITILSRLGEPRNRKGFTTIQAESLDFNFGSYLEKGRNDTNATRIRNRNMAAYYDMDFGTEYATGIQISVASNCVTDPAGSCGKLYILLDYLRRAPIATITVGNTHSFNNYTTLEQVFDGSVTGHRTLQQFFDGSVTGQHNVFLYYRSNTVRYSSVNIDWFKFLK